MARRGNSGALLLALSAFLCLLIPAAASADRHPTPSERKGIEQAAHRHYGEPGAKVKLSGIRVSTKNRSWATADVAVDYGASIQEYSGEFHRHSGGFWTDEEVGKMPAAVEDDLGLDDSSEGLRKVVRIVTFVVLGLLAVGIFSWLLSLGGDSSPGTGSPEPTPTRFDPGPTQAGDRPCPVCNNGKTTVTCRSCGGRRVKDNPHPPPPTVMCGGCFGRGLEDENCGNCSGTGRVRA
jgi:hypothetical protein